MLKFIENSKKIRELKGEKKRELKRLRKIIDSSDILGYSDYAELVSESIQKIFELEVRLEAERM